MNIQHRLMVLGLMVALVGGCLRVKPVETPAPSPVGEIDESTTRQALENEVPIGDEFSVKFETSKGDFIVEVHPAWAPRGAARFRELVEAGFYNENRFFRVVPGFMVQFGLNGDPGVQSKWRNSDFPDDPVAKSNTPGMVTFATAGPNSRTTQIFINYGNNAFLDEQGFSPFGVVTSGMDVVKAINSEYGERPDQSLIQTRGNAYLNSGFPKLDFVKTATLIPSEPATTEPAPTSEQQTPPSETKTTPAPISKPEQPTTPPETIEEIKN